MNISLCAVLLFATATFSAAARADDYLVLDQRADEFDRWQERVDATYGTPVIAREVNVPVVVIEEQRSRTRLGYGGLVIANALALETGASFDEIVALRSSRGYGWGRIARERNVNLGRLVSRLDRAEGEFRKVKIKTKHGKTEIKLKAAKGGKEKVKIKAHGKGKGKK